MADPLDEIEDNRQRLQLLWIRAHDGELLHSRELREIVQGFKAQMGIYKPKGARHALWVRETLQGPYADRDPTPRADGSWTYLYSPEGRGGKPDMNLATNKGLLKCMDDGVPLGVMRQSTSPSGKSAYKILGLAFVEGFDGEHFHLRSEPIAVERPAAQAEFIPFVAFEERRVSASMRLQRDSRFTTKVKLAYREKCAACQIGFQVKGLSVGLEAAHIIPANMKGTSTDVRNGMLLCRNHHALLDGWGWTMDEDLKVVIAKDKGFRRSAEPNHILKLEGLRLPNLPETKSIWPDSAAVRFRMAEFEKFWNRKA